MRTKEEHLKLLEFVIKEANFSTLTTSSKEVVQFFEYIIEHYSMRNY